MRRLGVILLVVSLSIHCAKDPVVDLSTIDSQLEILSPSNQRVGNPVAGKEYLITGDYINSGIPLSIFQNTLGPLLQKENLLERSGINEDIPYSYTGVDAPNGIQVVAPNCLQCHGGFVRGEFVLGLGDNAADYTADQQSFSSIVDALVIATHSKTSPEWEAYEPFAKSINATSKHLVTDVVGVNPADKLALVLAAHRDKDDLEWLDEPQFAIPDELIPADVPAWWLLKKKNRMFATGLGVGDFARIMMASSVLVIQDTTKASQIDQNFVDVQAFINQLEAPKFPGTIDQSKAEKGKLLFDDNCSKCHGKYGDQESYPNFLVKHEIIQTDPHLSTTNYALAAFGDWYNNSWFAKGDHAARVVATDGYVAPPLDGVWATAPFLHNGSVPTLETLLHSESRPQFWDKPATSETYNLVDVGIDFTEQLSKDSRYTYDTNKKGYGNKGHYFADHLSGNQRSQLIEYLKTL